MANPSLLALALAGPDHNPYYKAGQGTGRMFLAVIVIVLVVMLVRGLRK